VTPSTPLVKITDLHLEFDTFDGVSHVLNGVELQLMRGDVLGLVGETGCGKTLTALSISRLIRTPPARITSGTVEFDGRNVLALDDRQMRGLRGRRIAMIFQDPTANLNPTFTVGAQIVDAILNLKTGGDYPRLNPFAGLLPASRRLHKAAYVSAVELLRQVEVRDPERVMGAYPHALSVGLRQRCLIAMALSGRPDLLIADEPTTALDVRVQAQILSLLRRLVREMDLSVLLISHNLAVVAQICNRVCVMYAGNVVEDGLTADILRSPKHPYTAGLLASVPSAAAHRGELKDIPGRVPNFLDPPAGCRFHPRCEFAMPRCVERFPPAVRLDDGRLVNCVLYD
jgi:peptide/nickel transport system ATP-binding protein